MLIIWNGAENSFELKFDRSNFQNDLDCAKASGFKTTGPPQWVWYAQRAGPLKKLRENKPLSGLTITDEARAKFEERCKWEEEAEKAKKLVKEAKAEIKKSQSLKPIRKNPEIGPPVPKYVPSPPPSIRCIFCGDPVYEIIEKTEPLPMCLWCEKVIGDTQGE